MFLLINLYVKWDLICNAKVFTGQQSENMFKYKKKA